MIFLHVLFRLTAKGDNPLCHAQSKRGVRTRFTHGPESARLLTASDRLLAATLYTPSRSVSSPAAGSFVGRAPRAGALARA